MRADLALDISTYVANVDASTVDEFNRRHALRMRRCDVPDVEWPPTGARYRKLDFIPPGGGGR